MAKAHEGFNLENSSYGATICAERVAFINAICNGENSFTAIAIVADRDKPMPPCGICRQFMFEFAEELEIIMTNLKGDIEIKKLKQLLPSPFKIAS